MSSAPHQDDPSDPDCVFCGIAAGRLPAEVVAQNERALAFRTIEPVAPVHLLVISRAHHPDVAALASAAPDDLVALVRLGAAVAQDSAGGRFRLVFNSGPEAGQSVYHVHGHVLAGRRMTWPPG